MSQSISDSKTILITGAAGFIGFHLSKIFLSQGFKVIGIDNYDSYYDVKLKEDRIDILLQESSAFNFYNIDITNKTKLKDFLSDQKFNYIYHLAAQAGVRYSIENPDAYINTNIVGTYNLLESIKDIKIDHFLFASTSSVYGSNESYPFHEEINCNSQLSLYASTKRACEAILHSNSYARGLETTVFRFFTVYGPYGRPDMALFKFTKNILNGEKIDVYNHGKMIRDFTYVEDLVKAISLLYNNTPSETKEIKRGLSNSSNYRIGNIWNSNPVILMDYISAIESSLGKKADINFMKMQMGDVVKTHSDVTALNELVSYTPNTDIKDGVANFVDWYLNYHEYS